LVLRALIDLVMLLLAIVWVFPWLLERVLRAWGRVLPMEAVHYFRGLRFGFRRELVRGYREVFLVGAFPALVEISLFPGVLVARVLQ